MNSPLQPPPLKLKNDVGVTNESMDGPLERLGVPKQQRILTTTQLRHYGGNQTWKRLDWKIFCQGQNDFLSSIKEKLLWMQRNPYSPEPNGVYLARQTGLPVVS